MILQVITIFFKTEIAIRDLQNVKDVPNFQKRMCMCLLSRNCKQKILLQKSFLPQQKFKIAKKKTVKKVNGNALLGKIKFARNKRKFMSRKPKQFPNVTFLPFDKLSSPMGDLGIPNFDYIPRGNASFEVLSFFAHC